MKVSKAVLLIFLLSLLPLLSNFITPSLPHTHDGAVHLSRMAAYFKALRDGHILPRWAGDLNYGYGLPLFNFIYHTPYLVSSIFLSLGLSLVMTFKLVISISYILAGVFMYLFARSFFKNEKIAFLVAVFYQFAPFRLVELLMRGSFGELYTYTLLPLTLYTLTKFFAEARVRYFILAAASTGLLIISHNSISLMFFGILVLFILIFSPNKRVSLFCYLALLLGLLLSAFYWIPALAEHRYTYGDLFMKDLFRTHFPPLYQLILPNPFNDVRLQTGGIPVQIGFFHVLALAAALLVRKKLAIFCLVITGVAVFFMTKLSLPLWEHLSFLRQFQFSWRLLALINFSSALAAASFFQLSIFKKQWVYPLVVILVIVSTAYYWHPAEGFDKIADEGQFWNYPLNTTYFGETDVIWSAGPALAYPSAQAEVIDGKGTVNNFSKKTQVHAYSVSARTDVRLVDHTQYFPGWRVYVDGAKVPIQFQDANWRGQLTFAIPRGEHRVKVSFEETPLRLAADSLSIATLGTLGLSYLLWRNKKV
ncbi:hypothetical protein HY086_02010 [Candidatus Gottesmanbacteria bacterium]|nr:hypothetical protein [Candidatus Gottesmanbacteria bacterium]